MRNTVEVALQVSIYHEGVAFPKQPLHCAQRVLAAPPRPEAVAHRTELRLKDRLDHELDRRLNNAVFDRGNAQRSCLSDSSRDIHPLDRVRLIAAFPQRRPQLVQIAFRPCFKPLDALSIHPCRTLVGADFRPGRRQCRRGVHLVHQAVPTTSFDAVLQRQHHALRPHRSFHPRPITGFCTSSSLCGHCRCCHLLRHGVHASTSLPPFPRRGFAFHTSRGLRRLALTPAGLARTPQASPLTTFCFPNIPPPTTPCARTSLSQSPQRVRQVPGFAMNEQARRVIPPNRVRYPTGCSFASGCSPPRLTATQLPSATYVVTSYDMDFHLVNKTSSRTHSFPRRRESRKVHE